MKSHLYEKMAVHFVLLLPYSVYRLCKHVYPLPPFHNFFIDQGKGFSSHSNEKNNEGPISNIKLPEEPQNCCMSGCANCVWVAYAEELAKLLNDGGETAKHKIMKHVKDPNLRAFLMLELNHLFKKEK